MTPARDPKLGFCLLSWRRNAGGRITGKESLVSKHGWGLMEEESCRWNHGGGVMKEESSRRNMEEESWRRKHGGGIMEEETWRRKHGGGNMEEESWRGRSHKTSLTLQRNADLPLKCLFHERCLRVQLRLYTYLQRYLRGGTHDGSPTPTKALVPGAWEPH